jgi:hypothetical protein
MLKYALISLIFLTLLLVPQSSFAQTYTIPAATDWIDLGLAVDAAYFTKGWDSIFEGITPCAIVKKDNLYYGYYVAADNYITDLNNIGPSNRSIGVVTSPDGINWTKAVNKAIITFSVTGNPEEGAVSCGATLNSSNQIVMYYGANTSLSLTSNEVNADSYYAISNDGITFTNQTKVIAFNNSSVWGYGDELHAVNALFANNKWYAFYIPNGVSLGGRLGYSSGNSPTQLTQSGGVMYNNQTVAARGPLSIMPLNSSTLAYFVNVGKTTHIYTASTTNPTTLTSKISEAQLGGFGSIFYLDQSKNTWFSLYNTWYNLGLRVAPAGTKDTTPPTTPSNISATYPRFDQARLTWTASSDSNTGILRYEVLRNNQSLGFTTKTTFTDTGLTERTSYTYSIRAFNLHNTPGSYATATITTPADTIPPTISALEASGGNNQVRVIWDEPVAKASAENPANYTLTATTITAATLAADNRTVTLTTGSLIQNYQYTLTAKNVADRAQTANLSNTSATVSYVSLPGQISYWRLEESGPRLDSGGRFNHAKLGGSPTLTTGQLNQATAFSGNGQYLEVELTDNLAQILSSGHTFTTWFRFNSRPPNNRYDNDAYTILKSNNLRTRINASQQLVVDITTTTDTKTLTGPTLNTNTWYHLALAYTHNQNLAIYINGDPISGSPLSTGSIRPITLKTLEKDGMWQVWGNQLYFAVNNPLYTGESRYLHGALDEIRLFNRPLTQTEVNTLLTLTPGPTPGGPTPTPIPPSPTPAQKAGDANGDGKVDNADYDIWRTNYNQTKSGGATIGDFNNNGKVDGLDYLIWHQHFGT